ncbi:MAG: flavohemoglobin expression-modulating QEGLA motif protein [Proteobacteria bacterium]|nr:flavohemoglobin expression-modulating QEGLA motif protein [Pseudomonadota bacterium]MBU1060677.1 flavohemoglobin expression-modulating QEGLA motif protein [Pseudomonadota bacterium]
MQTLSEEEILLRIERKESVTAVVDTGAFSIKIDRYVPAVCTAIHAGHTLRRQIAGNLLLDEGKRQYEEDPYTGVMLASFPIVLQGLDSRYLYDLNRPPGESTPKESSGKTVWNNSLSVKEQKENISRHDSYYRVLHALLTVLEEIFSRCVIYDLHSYNYKRITTTTPLFNVGTYYIDQKTYQPVVNHLKRRLLGTEFPNIKNRAACDEVFPGKGYQAFFIHKNHPQSLCIPLAIKKVYMNELSGVAYPLILEAVIESLKQALSYNAAYFSRRFAGKRIQRSLFFAEESSKVIRRIDAALYKMAKGVDTLRYINPVNLTHERNLFFAKQCNYTPRFYYRQLKIDPFVFRKRLYAIPVDNIQDVSIRQLYRNTIDMLAQKIDLLTTIGTEHFLYNSLRFHGEPREGDIQLARFFIAAPPIEEENEAQQFNARKCANAFQKAINKYGFHCQVELSSRMVARATVSSGRRKVLINRSAHFTETEIQALIHHELGVHMVTTINSNTQGLKIFKLGLAGNTETQEGLAILSEYLSGNLTLERIKTLAHRVMAVHMMVQNYDFSKTYKALADDFGMSKEDAFSMSVRVYRGGGLTKDYLYLTGLRKLLQLYHSGTDLQPLFIGKTSIAFLDTLKEMLDRKVVTSPVHLPLAWKMKVESNPILTYLLRSVI